MVTSAPESWELAWEDVRTVDPRARLKAMPAPGVLVVRGEIAPGPLADGLRAQGIFVRHLFPVLRVVTGTDSAGSADRVVSAAVRMAEASLSRHAPFSVQTRVLAKPGPSPFEINRAVSSALEAQGWRLDVRHPVEVVSIVVGASEAYLGVSPVAYNLSDWAGGMRRFARDPGQISRAEFKLLEAVHVFALDPPPGGRALDLGAAPGGWTRILRSRGLRVVAVDPARLDARLTGDPGVRHVRATAETYLARHSAAERPGFDWLVNDMRIDAGASAHLMVAFAPLVRPAGIGLMTVKLKAKRQRQQVRAALDLLARAYRIDGARKLFHNRSEITVVVRRPND